MRRICPAHLFMKIWLWFLLLPVRRKNGMPLSLMSSCGDSTLRRARIRFRRATAHFSPATVGGQSRNSP